MPTVLIGKERQIMLQLKREVLDERHRVYHSRTRLTEQAAEIAVKGEPSASGVLGAILEVDGVSLAQVLAYCVMVEKAAMWEWAEIEPHLLRIFTALNGQLPDEAEIAMALQMGEADREA